MHNPKTCKHDHNEDGQCIGYESGSPEQKEECSEFHIEGFGDSIHKFCNDIAFQLHPSNDTMEAVRLIRQELPNLLSTQLALSEKRGRDAQQKEDYEIAKAQQEKAFKSGAEMGEERGRMETITEFVEWANKYPIFSPACGHTGDEEKGYQKGITAGEKLFQTKLLSFADSLKGNNTQKS